MKNKKSRFNMSSMLMGALLLLILGIASVWGANTLITQDSIIVDRVNSTDVNIAQPNNEIALYINTNATTTNGQFLYSNAVRTSEKLFRIKDDNPTSSSDVMEIEGDGTGNLLVLDQNGNGIALNIDSEATSQASYGLQVNTNQGAIAVKIDGFGTDSINLARGSADSTASNWFYRNSDSAVTAAPLFFIEQDNAADDQNLLNIQQDGTGNGLYVDQNGNAKALNIDSAATSSGVANFYTNAVHTGTGFSSNVAIRVDNAASTGDAVYIQQDGTGAALKISQAGNTCSLNVDADATCDAGTKIAEDNSIALCLVCS